MKPIQFHRVKRDRGGLRLLQVNVDPVGCFFFFLQIVNHGAGMFAHIDTTTHSDSLVIAAGSLGWIASFGNPLNNTQHIYRHMTPNYVRPRVETAHFLQSSVF